MGCMTPWNGNYRGVGGLKQKCPRELGGGGVGYYKCFLELHITVYSYHSQLKVVSQATNTPCF